MNLAELEVSTPGFSLQDLSHTNILSMPMGKIVPILTEFVHPGESIEIDFDWLCRTMPLNAPLMDTMEICFDAFWVPARTLGLADGEFVGFNYEQFFNPRNLQSDTALPHDTLFNILNYVLENEGKLAGTLYDYLGYPTFPECFRRIDQMMAGMSIGCTVKTNILDEHEEPITEAISYPFCEFANDIVQKCVEGYYTNFNLALVYYHIAPSAGDADFEFLATIPAVGSNYTAAELDNYNSGAWMLYSSFTAWVLRQYALYIGQDISRNGMLAVFNSIPKSLNDPFGFICTVLRQSPSQLYDSWKAWLFSKKPLFEKHEMRNTPKEFIFWSSIFTVDEDHVYHGWLALLSPDIDGIDISLVPFILYGRIVCDWYKNPLLVDGDAYFLNTFISLNDGTLSFGDMSYIDVSLANRLYGFDDAFVSATPSADQPNVLLPANPSVKDIRNASALQLMLERIAKTGKRYMDQILTTFGIQPDNKRLDRSEVLFRRTAILDMQSVTQMNQADFGKLLQSPIGSQVGQSVSFQTFQGNTITFDEHGFYVIMASIRPKASYFQGLNKNLRLLRADEFLIPDLAQIGDDQIKDSEIYFDFGVDTEGTFAYQQRYYNWMWHPSEIHGLMQNELDYYHLARRFSSTPVLNETFTSVNVDQNDLNRVFTSYDSTPFLMWFNFKEKMLRPLPTSSNYSL